MKEPIPSPYQEGIHTKDVGHSALLADLLAVYKEASKFEFHDYKGSKKYPIPKLALAALLERITSRAKSGYYANKNL